ncbi:MAG: thioredoxin-disulfide reductase [Candidatus Moranbacteria bacterium]|nr:thioredoxin-disulfide reductase [Candidatus Moranbacteria bacterium]
MYDVIIIGAGCAGLTAGIYAARAEKKVLILESESFGGQIASSPLVENYPGIKSISGNELVNDILEQALDLGVQVELEAVTELKDQGKTKIVVTEFNEYKAKTVIIATGLKHRSLNVEKEEQLTGHGISYCAVCDGAFFKDKVVAVVGGGNSALQNALSLTQYCSKVYLIHKRDSFKAEQKLIQKVMAKKEIEIIYDHQVTELLGESELTGVKIESVKNKKSKLLEVAALFVAVGRSPNNQVFADLLDLDQVGYIMADENCGTKIEGVFAAGDCRAKKVNQMTTAMADGTVAALRAVARCG